MTAELAKLKRWRWKREFKVILDFVKLWTHLYWSYLRPTEAKIVKFAAEDSWRGASNNLKVVVPAALSHVCRNSRWSCESATKQLHVNVGEVVRMRRPSWGEVRNDSNRWRRCVVDWTVFRTLNTSPGVVGGHRTSANRDKLLDSRPTVLSPFIACRTVPTVVLLCRILLFDIIPIFVHVLNCHFYISSLFNSIQGIQIIAVELVFADLKGQRLQRNRIGVEVTFYIQSRPAPCNVSRNCHQPFI